MNAKFQANEIVINGMTFPASYEILPDRVRIRADVKSGPACGVYAIDVMAGEANYSEALRAARGDAGEEKIILYYQAAYAAGNGIYSSQLFRAHALDDAKKAAAEHAERYGYAVESVVYVAFDVAEGYIRRGMPCDDLTKKAAEPVQEAQPAPEAEPEQVAQPEQPKKAKKARRSTKAKKAAEPVQDAEPAPEAQPVQAKEPAQPEQVAQPVQAKEPAQPEQVAQPVQAEEPAQPAPEVQPEQAADPVQEAQPEQPAQPRTVPEKTFLGDSIKGAGWVIVFDSGSQRTRVIVTEQAREAAAPIIERAGFFWSPNMQSYNKKLTHKAHRAALALADELRAALAC